MSINELFLETGGLDAMTSRVLLSLACVLYFSNLLGLEDSN